MSGILTGLVAFSLFYALRASDRKRAVADRALLALDALRMASNVLIGEIQRAGREVKCPL